MTVYKVEGEIVDGNTATDRSLRLIGRDSGLLIASTTSSGGLYSFRNLKTNDEVQVLCLGESDEDDRVHRTIPIVDPDPPEETGITTDLTLDSNLLPENLIWIDQFDWSNVVQEIDYSTQGALFVQESLKHGGRPITLMGTDTVSYISESLSNALSTKQQQAGLVMTLTINGDEYEVIFRQNEQPLKIIKVYQQDITILYRLDHIKLMTVENS